MQESKQEVTKAEVAGNLPNVYIVTLMQINPCLDEPGYTLPLHTV